MQEKLNLKGIEPKAGDHITITFEQSAGRPGDADRLTKAYLYLLELAGSKPL